jgi:hypothetical protein
MLEQSRSSSISSSRTFSAKLDGSRFVLVENCLEEGPGDELEPDEDESLTSSFIP